MLTLCDSLGYTLDAGFLSFPESPFPLPGSHLESHITFTYHISLGSSWLRPWWFWGELVKYFIDFFSSGIFPGVFLMIRWGGRRLQRRRAIFHTSQGRAHALTGLVIADVSLEDPAGGGLSTPKRLFPLSRACSLERSHHAWPILKGGRWWAPPWAQSIM